MEKIVNDVCRHHRIAFRHRIVPCYYGYSVPCCNYLSFYYPAAEPGGCGRAAGSAVAGTFAVAFGSVGSFAVGFGLAWPFVVEPWLAGFYLISSRLWSDFPSLYRSCDGHYHYDPYRRCWPDYSSHSLCHACRQWLETLLSGPCCAGCDTGFAVRHCGVLNDIRHGNRHCVRADIHDDIRAGTPGNAPDPTSHRDTTRPRL